jgi:hypothetical protein
MAAELNELKAISETAGVDLVALRGKYLKLREGYMCGTEGAQGPLAVTSSEGDR